MKRGFLAGAGGALYPKGSAEAKPACWRSKSAQPTLQLSTTDAAYEVSGRFIEAKGCLGKEDFSVNRTGLVLRIQGNPQEDPQSLVAGFDQSFQLPLDADFASMGAEFRDYTLRIRIPRLQGPLADQLTPEMLEILNEQLAKMSPDERKQLQEEAERAEEARASGAVEDRVVEVETPSASAGAQKMAAIEVAAE